MGISYTQSTDTSTDMGLKDYSKSRMRENCKYGSVRGGQSNLIPSTRLPPQAGALWMLSHGAMSLQESIERFILSPGWGGKGTRVTPANIF